MELGAELVDRAALRRLRLETGGAFDRLLGYFREDAAKSVTAIEEAMRRGDGRGLVLPAHTLKGEALQFGAEPLGGLAEQIELTARRCIETQTPPDLLIADVARLRPLLYATLAALVPDVAPVTAARTGFGRRSFGTAVR
jgi:HPt (histidine-containing phosphotransfer) domain-containing protein